MDRFFYTYVSVNFWSYCSIGKRWFIWFLLSGICWNFYLWPNIWPVLVMISCAFKNTYFLFECKVCFLCFLSTCLSLRETCSVLPQWLWGLSIPVFKNHFFYTYIFRQHSSMLMICDFGTSWHSYLFPLYILWFVLFDALALNSVCGCMWLAYSILFFHSLIFLCHFVLLDKWIFWIKYLRFLR